MAVTRPPGGSLRRAKRWRWLLIGGVGLAFWIVFLVLSAVYGLGKMAPTVLLLGSFLVPVTIVVWNLDHLADLTLDGARVTFAFIGGGLLGLVLAGPLNWSLVAPLASVAGPWANLTVGLTEEGAKLVALVIFSIGLARYTTRNGVVLGSAVGFGFAAFETAGYAHVQLLDAGLWGAWSSRRSGEGCWPSRTRALHGDRRRCTLPHSQSAWAPANQLGCGRSVPLGLPAARAVGRDSGPALVDLCGAEGGMFDCCRAGRSRHAAGDVAHRDSEGE